MIETFTSEKEFIEKQLGMQVELVERGRRGVVFKAFYKNQDVAIKVPKLSSKANNSSYLEAKNLEKVNALGIGPKIVEYTNEYVIMEFIHGQRIGDFLAGANNEEKKRVLDECIRQCKVLDLAKINKFEMTNPYKHILITSNERVVFIDFERARVTQRPKNESQFNEYIKKIDLGSSKFEKN